MIDIKNLSVSVDDKCVISSLSLTFEPGKNYCILGKNGSGKSSFVSALMGHPSYNAQGSVLLDGKDLLAMTPEERSAAGLFLSFQAVPEIKGVRLVEYLREITNIHLKRKNPETPILTPFTFRRFLKPLLQELDIAEAFLDRDLNVGFSGGEKRKIEMLQLRLIKPKYIILDEVDSGLDLDAFRTIAQMLAKMSGPETSIIIITHYFTILDYVSVDTVYLLEKGTLVQSGCADLAEGIRKNGFRKECAECPLDGDECPVRNS